MFSPRTWGCFHLLELFIVPHEVFPTHVGVFLKGMNCSLRCKSFPHARGGVSDSKKSGNS